MKNESVWSEQSILALLRSKRGDYEELMAPANSHITSSATERSLLAFIRRGICRSNKREPEQRDFSWSPSARNSCIVFECASRHMERERERDGVYAMDRRGQIIMIRPAAASRLLPNCELSKARYNNPRRRRPPSTWRRLCSWEENGKANSVAFIKKNLVSVNARQFLYY